MGHRTRAPIDGSDDEDEFRPSRSNTDRSYHTSERGFSEEAASSSSAHIHMQERPHPVGDDLPIFLPHHLAYNTRIPEEYDPYLEQENPFNDRHAALSRFIRQPRDSTEQNNVQQNDKDNDDVSEESTYLRPPQLWPQLGQLPTAFGSPGSEIQLDFSRPTLRVTNGLDDSAHA